jgi:hypothetical protein
LPSPGGPSAVGGAKSVRTGIEMVLRGMRATPEMEVKRGWSTGRASG